MLFYCRRFNKFNKVQLKSVGRTDRHIKTSRKGEIHKYFIGELGTGTVFHKKSSCRK
jgi:hypothetical protein